MNASFFERHPLLKDFFSIGLFVVCVIIGTIIINSFIFRSYSVDGPSMEQTLKTGDRLIINRLPSTWAGLRGNEYTPKRGEIIVFENPNYSVSNDANKYIVKRVIAFGGEQVILKSGKLMVYNNDFPDGFEPDKTGDYDLGDIEISGNVNLTVPQGELFVAGDHRNGNYSHDSRNGLGTVPLYDVVGPVVFRFFPFNKIDTF